MNPRRGANRVVLERIKESGRHLHGHSQIAHWILDGAAVHVSMVGFDNGIDAIKTLNGSGVKIINSDLTSAADITKAQRLNENRGLSFKGCEPGGPFDIDSLTAREFLAAPLNVNNRPNSDVVRPVMNAADLMGSSRQMFTVDFGLMTETEAACYKMPFDYVRTMLYPMRQHNRERLPAPKLYWWLHARMTRPEMREAIRKLQRYIVTPRRLKAQSVCMARQLSYYATMPVCMCHCAG